MKRVLSIIIVFALSLIIIGCKKSIVLNEDVRVEANKEYKITETKVDIKNDFRPFMYTGDKVYGTTPDISKYDARTYVVNKNGEFKTNDVNFAIKSNLESYAHYGLTQEFDKEKQGSLREFYYRDSISDITIKLEGYNELTKEYRSKNGYSEYVHKKLNNEKYLPITISKYQGDNETNIAKVNFDQQQVVIVDIESEKIYYKENDNSNIDECVYSFYYDNSVNSIMAIMYSGKVKKINFNDKFIEFEDYKTLNLQGYEIHDNGLIYSENEILQDKLIIKLKNKEDKSMIYGIYNINISEVSILEKDISIAKVLEKDGLFTMKYKENSYLAQMNEDYTIKYLYKASDDNYKCIISNSLINEEGNSIFIVKNIYEDEGKQPIKNEYLFLELSK